MGGQNGDERTSVELLVDKLTLLDNRAHKEGGGGLRTVTMIVRRAAVRTALAAQTAAVLLALALTVAPAGIPMEPINNKDIRGGGSKDNDRGNRRQSEDNDRTAHNGQDDFDDDIPF